MTPRQKREARQRKEAAAFMVITLVTVVMLGMTILTLAQWLAGGAL